MQIRIATELRVSDDQPEGSDQLSEPDSPGRHDESQEPDGEEPELGAIIHESDSATIYDTSKDGIEKPLVYKCFHKPLSQAGKERFDEACAAAKALDHANLTAVYEYGIADDGNAYVISEKAEGTSLSVVLAARGALNAVTTASVFSQILDAIDYALAAHISIGDLSPERIFVKGLDTDAPVVKITSIGVTRNSFEQDISAKSLVSDLNAALYASPERCLGKETDQRSIVYSIGCMLHEVVFGKRLFEGADPIKLLFDHVNTTVSLPTNTKSGFGRYWKVVQSCLMSNPDHRFKDIARLRHHIENLEEPIKNERDATFFQQVAMRMTGARTPLGAEVFVVAMLALMMLCTTACITRHIRQCDKLERRVQKLLASTARPPQDMVKEWKEVEVKGAQLGQPPSFIADCEMQVAEWDREHGSEAFAHFKNAAKIYRRCSMLQEESDALYEAIHMFYSPGDPFNEVDLSATAPNTMAHFDKLRTLMERQIELGRRLESDDDLMMSRYSDLADLYMMHRDYAAARDTLLAGFAAYPSGECLMYWMQLGGAEYKLNHPRAAIHWYEKVAAQLKTDPYERYHYEYAQGLIDELASRISPASDAPRPAPASRP